LNFTNNQELPYNLLVVSGYTAYFLNVIFVPEGSQPPQVAHPLIDMGYGAAYKTLVIFYGQAPPPAQPHPRNKRGMMEANYPTGNFTIGYKPGVNGFDPSTLPYGYDFGG
jgi:hypothetical protein